MNRWSINYFNQATNLTGLVTTLWQWSIIFYELSDDITDYQIIKLVYCSLLRLR